MFTYKRVIRCRNMVEVEIYNSIREVGKSYGGRGVSKTLSRAKQKIANQIRTTRKWEQIIDCNFDENDYFCRFSAPYGTFDDEKKFMNHIRNFFDRIKRRADKQGLAFKYIGFRECGKRGKNWHLHIILSAPIAAIAKECWYYRNGGMNFTPLYCDHSYEKLAQYIRKDITAEKKDDGADDGLSLGGKRMMASRNLSRPVVTVKKCSRRELRKLERGEYMEPPKGFYLSKDELSMSISDVTGAAYYFKFRALDAFRMANNRMS